MKIHFSGDIEGLEQGLTIICHELNIERGEDGFPIDIKQMNGPLKVSCQQNRGEIYFQEKIHFFRALGLWLQEFEENNEFNLSEVPHFKTNGVMVDVSRNAVMTVDGIQNLLKKMALMGLNIVMVYTEDTFTVEKYPYFGYMRGRYSEQELHACDDYANSLGIEMIPCIQTLAHLTEALKWNYAAEIKDTSDILLVGSDKTYDFIEELMKAASLPFRSKRIHIGMDEAHQLGLGKYLEQHGYQKRFEIMNEHLHKVVDLAEKLSLKPMIWSDMYFRLGSRTGDYYDLNAQIPDDVIESMPKDAQLVYWDYYHTDEEFYRTFLQKHKRFGSEPIFAGGVWTWNGIAPNYGKTFATTKAALEACKKEGITEVFATMWGDNGAETHPFAGLAGLQLFAEHGYGSDVSHERLAKRFAFCTGGNLDDFLALNELDETPGVSKDNPHESHPSKFLLWQDVLLGLYDGNIRSLPLSEHYADLASRLEKATKRNKNWSEIFSFYTQLSYVLSVKADIGIKIKDAFDRNDKKELTHLKDLLPSLRGMVDDLRKLHRSLWFSTLKPFGWEVIDIRYGGVLSRLDSAEYRLQQWLDGTIDRIEELEEERLYHDAPWVMPKGALGRNSYHRIVTAGVFSS
ncbi:beta-N-acetylhexosaminidase [Neobacillus vireti]|uniref:Glycoside hydrolase family protein n=1 Tax=Neobacillus vireti LMG 21834 TaxID=1131730 RepID=A0AB94IKG9_9BACI|nr:beta-N-acetylhexosaminidase [Neobacillus vireti]ETI67512.1 glycoside hydrolase family protein [Neobacillus vireti LMG 21834]KLT18525.1 glycoside hydrolase [Neobacillus vireti]